MKGILLSSPVNSCLKTSVGKFHMEYTEENNFIKSRSRMQAGHYTRANFE
jgi:hypothetical protein